MKTKQMAKRLHSVSTRKKAKQLLAVTLAALMLNPVTGYGVATSAQGVETITGFAKLPSEIATQQLAVGTEESDIQLPNTLKVPTSNAKVVLSSGEISLAAKTTDSAISSDLDGADTEQTENKEVASQERTLTGITWRINAQHSGSDTFDSANAGAVFFYEPVLPKGYILAKDVSLPQIKVQIKDSDKWAFSQSKTIDGVEITVKAEKDVFPKGAVLHAQKVIRIDEKKKIQDAVSKEIQVEDTAKTVAELVSFDITITDVDGNVLQPDTSKGEVRVSFAKLPMVTKDAAPTQELKVFHMDDSLNKAERLDTTLDQEACTLEAPAKHFSLYTVALLRGGAKSPHPQLGDGSLNTPYQITTWEELFWFAKLVNGKLEDGTAQNKAACATLMNDITINDKVLENGSLVSNTSGLLRWTPIGGKEAYQSDLKISYSGVFDGGNHTISGIYVKEINKFYVGFFGACSGGTIKNLKLKDSYVEGSSGVGGICGYSTPNSAIVNCTNGAEVLAYKGVGGICGMAYTNSKIEKCGNTGFVSATTDEQADCGGICGANKGATILNCWSSGTVTAQQVAGGICGVNENNSSVTNCYNYGPVIENTWCGAIVGKNSTNGIIENCYYDTQESKSSGIGTDYSNKASVTGKTTAEFASGEVCYGLNKEVSDGTQIWYQNIDVGLPDNYPKFTGETVLKFNNRYTNKTQPLIVITAQPQDAQSVTYGYAAASTMSVAAEKTDAAPADSNISYQWYMDDAAIDHATEASYGIPTGLDVGTHSFYCEVSCDGYAENSESAAFTVEKAMPTVTLNVYTREDEPFIYGNGVYLQAFVKGVNGENLDGRVTFKNGDNDIITSDFNSHSNSYSAGGSQYLKAGEHSFTAVYNPSTDGIGKNYEGVTSAPVVKTIDKREQSELSITKVTGKKYGDADFTLEALGGSGTGAVSFSVSQNNGVLSISGNTAKIIGAGTVTVTATKAGEEDAYKDITATRDITIGKAPAPSIDYPKASGITYGQKLSASVLREGSSAYGTFAWTDGNTVSTVANSGYEVTFTPNANTTKNYEANTNTTDTVAITVSKATPAVAVNAVVSDNAGSRKATLTATVTGVGDGETPTGTVKFVNSTSGSDEDIAGATAVSITGGKATYTWIGLGNQIYKVKAVYNGSGNYNTANSTELSFDTNKQNQAALIIESIGTKTYGDGTFILSATGGSGNGVVSFTSSDPNIVSVTGDVATIHKAGTVIITANKAATDFYNEATTSVSLTVEKKALRVKVDDKLNVVKGAVMPKFTYTVSGLVGSDSFTSPTVSTTATDTHTVGEYDILISGGTLANADSYAITYVNGKLIVVKGSYIVTVTNGTGGGSYSEGHTVTITANSLSGYTFTGWSSSNGIIFANSAASTTTFIMPDKAVTVAANYSKNSSGGGSSGGSSTTTTQEKKPNQSVTAVDSVIATVGANGTASASISDKLVTDAIAKAQADAKTQGKTANEISVKLNVTMPKGTASLTTTLTRSALDSLVSAGVSSFEINGTLVKVSFDKKALTEIQKKSNDTISIAIAPKTNLSDAAKKMIGTRPVYDITVGYGSGQSISNFGGGIATVAIPYTLGKNEVAGGLYAVYVDEKGNATRIAGSAYDANSGCVIFTTPHFSQYGIGYTTPAAKFTDISSHWAKESIDYVVGRGLISGTSETTFSPQSAMTRGMLVTALVRLAGVDTKAYTENSLTDVNADSTYRPYIEWAYSKGIIQGIGNSQFAPDRAITRQEIAVIFANYAKIMGYTLPITREAITYTDASSIGSPYKDAVKVMQQAGIMMGGSGNKFNPKGNATRAEVSAMLNRYIKLTINPTTGQDAE